MKQSDPAAIRIESLGLTLTRAEADASGIIECLNTTLACDEYQEESFGGWDQHLLGDPNNMVLNNPGNGCVTSSLIRFRDTYSQNLFTLRHLWIDMEGSYGILNLSLLN